MKSNLLFLADAALARLEPLLLLGTRLAVALPFFKSGLVKIGDFENAVYLFTEEFRVPVLSPALAAALATAGELALPVLLALGLATRYAALGLSALNVMAVYAYAHVLFQPGFEAALGQHYQWGFMALVLVVFGAGGLSVDGWLGRRARPADGTGAAATSGTTAL